MSNRLVPPTDVHEFCAKMLTPKVIEPFQVLRDLNLLLGNAIYTYPCLTS